MVQRRIRVVCLILKSAVMIVTGAANICTAKGVGGLVFRKFLHFESSGA